MQGGAVALVLRPRGDGGATGRTPASRRTGRSCGARRCSGRTGPDRISARAGQHSGCGDWAWREGHAPLDEQLAHVRQVAQVVLAHVVGQDHHHVGRLLGDRGAATGRGGGARHGDPAPAVAERAAGLVPGLRPRATRASATTTRAASGRRRGQVERCGTTRSPLEPRTSGPRHPVMRPGTRNLSCSQSAATICRRRVGCDVDPGVPLRYPTDEGVKQQCQEPTALPPTRPRPSARARSSASTPSVVSSSPARSCWPWSPRSASSSSTATSTATSTTESLAALGDDRPEKIYRGNGEPLNILVMGDDTRSGEGNDIDGETGGGGSDTTILVHLSADRKRSYAISIPRDSIVDRPDCEDSDRRQPTSSGTPPSPSAARCAPWRSSRRTPTSSSTTSWSWTSTASATWSTPSTACRSASPRTSTTRSTSIFVPAGDPSLLTGDEALDYVRARYVGERPAERHQPHQAAADLHRGADPQGQVGRHPDPPRQGGALPRRRHRLAQDRRPASAR